MTVDVGLIGRGYWGSILHKKLETLGNVRFACSGRDASDYVNLLHQVSWVFVATPNITHYEIVRRCLSQGVNLFCEKPMTANAEESRELHQLAQQRNARLYVDDVYYFRNETKQIVARGLTPSRDSITFINRKYGSFKDNIFN